MGDDSSVDLVKELSVLSAKKRLLQLYLISSVSSSVFCNFIISSLHGPVPNKQPLVGLHRYQITNVIGIYLFTLCSVLLSYFVNNPSQTCATCFSRLGFGNYNNINTPRKGFK